MTVELDSSVSELTFTFFIVTVISLTFCACATGVPANNGLCDFFRTPDKCALLTPMVSSVGNFAEYRRAAKFGVPLDVLKPISFLLYRASA